MERNESNPYLRTADAADYVGLTVSTLAKMRMRGDGPRYSKAGPRIIVYAREDLDAWLAERARQSTSEHVAGGGA
ncbi:MAG: helix-turn-helix transcriptional regulator [Myxococcota bacterium]